MSLGVIVGGTRGSHSEVHKGESGGRHTHTHTHKMSYGPTRTSLSNSIKREKGCWDSTSYNGEESVRFLL